MKPIRLVRKRDARLVEFDESKIADAIYKAALSVGGEDRFLAEELASVVTLFLEKTFGEAIPSIEDVQDMVEKVLIETGHAQTAKAYILYREKRTKVRTARDRPPGPVQRTLFEPGPLTLLDPAAETAVPFSRERLTRTLAAEVDLPPDAAEEVAAAVEDRVLALERERVPASLLSKLIDSELLAQGHDAAVKERGAIAVERQSVESSLFPKERDRQGTPASRLSGLVLRQYALGEIHGEDVAAAHLAGRISLAGLDRPGAIHAASFSPDALRAFGIPGLAGRFRPEALSDPRRFSSWFGRAVRAVAPHATHGLCLSRANLLLSPLFRGLSYEDLKEEAWHLLSELAGVDGLEVELSLDPPPILAARKARGPAGELLSEPYSRFTGTALQLARAFLDVRGTGEGLGPRADLPRLTLTLGADALTGDAGRAVVARAVTEAMDREPVLLVLDRENLPLLGTRRARVRLEDATRLTDTATLSVAVASRAVVNLPHAAYRAGPRQEERFWAEVDEAARLAIEAIRERRRFLVRAGAGPDGPLAALTRPRADAPPLLDLPRATNSVGVLGLNEAVSFVLGDELHESDEAVKFGQKVLSLVRHACEAARNERLHADVDAEDEPELLARLAAMDRKSFPRHAEQIPERYGAGVSLREDAPVDLPVRLELEGRLGLGLRTATVCWHLPENEHPALETVIALLKKTWTNTRIRQLRLGRRERRP